MAKPGRQRESNLTVQIAALRRILGETPGGGSWIETVPRRGYRFAGPVVTAVEKGANEVPPWADAAPDPCQHRVINPSTDR